MSDFYWLTIIVVLPISAGSLIALLPHRGNKVVRWYTICICLFELLLTTYVFCYHFKLDDPLIQLEEDFNWINLFDFHWRLGIDGLSIGPILLTGFITTLATSAAWPYIIYTRERQETERVYLSKEVYEDRKESYVQRINAMIEYAESENRCRSRMLLRYFGEKNEHNCGQCDVCLQQHQSGLKSGEFEAISQQLQALLKENPLSLQEIKDKMQVPENHLMKVVSYLVSEEIIRQENGYLKF